MDTLITATTAKNLRELAEYIEANVTQEQINMEEYFTGQMPYNVVELEDSDVINHVDCGTVACALGHATSVFPIKPSHFPDGMFNMDEFGRDYFPALYINPGNINNTLWDEVFGTYLDPDKEKVVQRLRDMADRLSEM